MPYTLNPTLISYSFNVVLHLQKWVIQITVTCLLIIPFKHIKKVSVNPSSLTSEVINIKIKANNHTFDMMLKADNASLEGFTNYIEKMCS